jgi:hypothetical protein
MIIPKWRAREWILIVPGPTSMGFYQWSLQYHQDRQVLIGESIRQHDASTSRPLTSSTTCDSSSDCDFAQSFCKSADNSVNSTICKDQSSLPEAHCVEPKDMTLPQFVMTSVYPVYCNAALIC